MPTFWTLTFFKIKCRIKKIYQSYHEYNLTRGFQTWIKGQWYYTKVFCCYFFNLNFFYQIFWGKKSDFFFHTIILKSFDWWTSELENSKKLWKRISSYTLSWPWPIVTLRSIILWTMLSTQDSMGNIFFSNSRKRKLFCLSLFFRHESSDGFF